MIRSFVLRWFAPLLVVLSAAGCSVYDKSLITNDTCTPGSLGCIPANRPGTSSPSDSMVASYALRGIFLNQTNNAWKTIGFNLDNAVTSGANPVASCTSPNGGSVSIDGDNGIDNVFGSILVPQLLTMLFPTLEADMCCFMERGRGVLILRIEKWNGQPNDSQVTVSLLSAVDATTAQPNTVMWDSTTEHGLLNVSGGGSAPGPTWTADSSSFYVSRGDFSLGMEGNYDAVKQRSDLAYVRDGYIVMPIKSTEPVALFFANVGGIRIPLIGGTMVAHISADGTTIDSGVMGGRMSGDGLLEANVSLVANDINAAATTTDRMTICNSFSSIVGNIVQQNADVTANLVDNMPTSTCDAMSVGISFNGVRARSLELAGEAICIPKGDCINYGAGISCPTIPETDLGPNPTTAPTTPICWLGASPNGNPGSGGCNLTDWNSLANQGDGGVDAGP